jgi:hypothetical protein
MARPSGGGKPTPGSFFRLDVRWLKREGLLEPGRATTLRETHYERPRGVVGIEADESGVTVTANGRTQWLGITVTPVHLGGSRPWFRCGCGNRAAILYGSPHTGGPRFACRECKGLAYPSQREDPRYRPTTMASRIRQQLGGSPSLAAPFPDKPKGMHWTTYERRRARGQAYEQRGLAGMAAAVERLRRRIAKVGGVAAR